MIFRAGLLPAETIENALEEGVKTGRRLGEILVERNLIKEEDLTRLLAGQKGLPYVSLREREVEHDAARLLDEDQARLFTALPISFEEGVPVVAVADPTNDVLNRNIREALGQEARFVVAARSELNEVIGEIFSGAHDGTAAGADEAEVVEEAAPEFDIRVPLPDPEDEAAAEGPEQALEEPEPVLEAREQVLEVPEPVAEASEPLQEEPELVQEAAADPEPLLEAAPAEPEPDPEPVLAAAPPVPEPEVTRQEEPELVVAEAVVEQEAVEAHTPELVVAASEPVLEAAPAEPEPESVLRVDQQPEADPVTAEPVVEELLVGADPEPELVLESPAPALAPEPEPAEPANEPVAAESDPHTNGRVPETFEDDTPPSTTPEPAAYRVSIRLTSGEQLTVADCEDIGEAKGYAKALTKQLASEGDDWPFVNGRFLKPDTIVSVDVEPL